MCEVLRARGLTVQPQNAGNAPWCLSNVANTILVTCFPTTTSTGICAMHGNTNVLLCLLLSISAAVGTDGQLEPASGISKLSRGK